MSLNIASSTKVATRLTKKQKKSLAFRKRSSRSGSGKSRGDGLEDEDFSLPAMEDEDMVSSEGGEVEIQALEEQNDGVIVGKRKGKSKGAHARKQKDSATEAVDVVVVGKANKRKRDVLEREGTEDRNETQKRKRKRTDEDVTEAGEDGTKTNLKQRFILFIGNLKYSTSREVIQEHFAICDPPPVVRLLTPKSSTANKTSTKSRGCAFLEFSHRNALQQGLKLHHSTLDGRKINVELTAGGGGKSQARLAKLQGRNRGLQDQRKQKRAKDTTAADGSVRVQQPEKPQRYSSTSGINQAPTAKRTWSVGDPDDEKTRRGGQKHLKKHARKVKPWGTGVNAIPVG